MDNVANAVASVTREKPKRLTIFRGDESALVDRETTPMVGIDESVKAGFAKIAAATLHPGDAQTSKMMYKTPGPEGMSLVHVWFKSGYILPRHSHNTDCIYYITAGELQMGSQTLRAGDGMFVPADQAYTYQAGPEGVEVLEFRNADAYDIRMKGNDPDHWDRMAETNRERGEIWVTEGRPSKRAQTA